MLTARFNIPVEKLSFEHIAELRHNKESERELEKIIKILESGELGHFPELLERARDKLVQVNKHHALVRSPQVPVEKLQALDPRQVTRLRSELNEWCSEMREKQPQVANKETRGKKAKATNPGLNIRGHIITAPSKHAKKTKARIKSCDYAAWDKFDADVEIKSMEASVEREKTRLRRQELRKHVKADNTAEEKPYQTPEEKSYADSYRLKGNTAYKASKYQEAIKLYTESIQLHSTATCLSNRAQVYLKLGQFSAALQDCEAALRLDPHFIKAVYRKALALYNLKKYGDAIEWFGRFLKEEPNNKTAHAYMTKLHNIVPVTLRLDGSQTLCGDPGKQKAKIEVLDDGKENSSELIRERRAVRENVESGEPRNEWGFQKQVYVPTRRGLPKFMVQYEKYMKTSTRRKTSNTNETFNALESKSSGKLTDQTPRGETQNLSSDSERKHEFLNVNDDYTPTSIVNIIGNGSSKPVRKKLQIELIPSGKKDRASTEGEKVVNLVTFEE